jgi:uncharacterized protein (DUF1800 family)
MVSWKAWGRLAASLWIACGLAACGGGGGGSTDVGAPAGADVQKQALAAPSVLQFNGNGWYWNPAEGGSGFMFEAQGNKAFVAFFMYEEGSGKPIWYSTDNLGGSFVANADGSYVYTGSLWAYSGGQPAWSPTYVAPTARNVGTAKVTFSGSGARVDLPGRSFPATRFDFNGLTTTLKPNQPEIGWYWNPAEGGRGYAMEVQNDRLFMALFHYNQDGSPTWNVVEAAMPDGVASGLFVGYSGGQSLTSAYRPPERHELGRFNLSFRNTCAGQIQLAGAPAVAIRRFFFGDLAKGAECRAVGAVSTDNVPGLEAGPVRMQPGDQVFGRVDTAGDVDVYGIALTAGVTYRFDLKGAPSGSGTLADPLLRLYDAALLKLAENNNVATGQLDSSLTFTPATSGTYYLAALANGNGVGSFLLQASGVAGDLSVQPVLPAAAFAGTVQAKLSGAQGGTASLVVDATGGIGGTVQLATGAALTAQGSVRSGGVVTFTATGFTSSGVGLTLQFSGYLDPQGQLSGTWSEASVGAGVAFGRSSMPAPAPAVLTVRARGTLNAGVGPTMVVRVDGTVIGSTVVQATVPTDYAFNVTSLPAGAKVDVAFTNDANSNGEDRNLFISYLSDGKVTVTPTSPGATVDRGSGDKAYDGVDVVAGVGELYSNGALRLVWPAVPGVDATLARRYQAARLLQQASFGPTTVELNTLVSMSDAEWIDRQLAMPAGNDFVPAVQRLYDQGAAFRPGGASYDTTTPVRTFWAATATAPDQLRKRVMLALQEIIVVSQADSNLFSHTRAYAAYLDMLNRHAFGNYRALLEDVALSPVMGIYLSHMRNRKEDPATGRVPDENFAREVMQLFSIGLVELNQDGTPRLDGNGQPIETYNNADVMNLAKVFTGWSWAFPDAQLTENNFRFGNPNYAPGSDLQIDLQRMKAYPNQHSTSEKRLFAGKPSAVVIPANTQAADSLRIALDTLFNHPNVGPFIGRQLIQRLVTSNPSPAYVARVAAAFANNGAGVRGDMAAVIRQILLDPEARQAPGTGFGKLREPILRVAQFMRAFNVASTTGNFQMAFDLDSLSQRPFNEPSVFSFFRPGYVPPNTVLADAGVTAPEFQLVNETTAPLWVNLAETMVGSGLGSAPAGRDVVADFSTLAGWSAAGNVDAILEALNQLLLGGRMSAALRTDILDAMAGVTGSTDASHLNRAKVAVFMALASPEFLIQR